MLARNPVAATYRAQPVTGVNRAEVDVFNATNCIVVESHQKIKCDIAHGAGKSHLWKLRIAQQDSLSPTSSYHPPQILSITGPGAENGATNGGDVVFINGLNFGPYTYGAKVSYGVTGMNMSDRLNIER